MNVFITKPETGGYVLCVLFEGCFTGLRQKNKLFIVTEIRVAKFRMRIQFQGPDDQLVKMTDEKIRQVKCTWLRLGEFGESLRTGKELIAVCARQAVDTLFGN
jgi:hypothetical protein